MTLSLRKVGLAAGAAVLMSAATASGALAANPITVSLSGSTLVIDDPTGVTQATSVSTSGTGFEIEELNSGNELQLGAGLTQTVVWSNSHWVVEPTSPTTITRVTVWGDNGNDLVNTVGVTNANVSLFGEAGTDYLVAGGGSDIVNGGDDADQVFGGAGNDLLNGGTGSDNIWGQNGDDQIVDKDGYADTVDGGNDYDTFRRDAGLDTATNIETYL